MENLDLDLLSYRTLHHEVSTDIQDSLNIVEKSRTSYFTWKGQFSPQLIEFLLSQYPSAQSILDPFCGSGTVVYESILNNKQYICGIDINPAAIIFAKFPQYSKLNLKQRNKIFLETKNKILVSIEEKQSLDEVINTSILNDYIHDHLAQCIFLNAFKDKSEISLFKIFKSIQHVEKKLLTLPYSTNTKLEVEVGDSRNLKFDKSQFDLIITSPPYINVFNYHHNYRKSIEALGEHPLIIAKSEIGANRKFRSNRFNIVTQYCIDMAMSLYEMHRVTKYNKNIILIIGNSSTVKGKKFFNGEIIYLIAKSLNCFDLTSKFVREFRNRYGVSIKEEVLIFLNRKSRNITNDDKVKIGRDVANYILSNTLKESNTEDNVYNEIKEAIENIKNINPGSFANRT